MHSTLPVHIKTGCHSSTTYIMITSSMCICTELWRACPVHNNAIVHGGKRAKYNVIQAPSQDPHIIINYLMIFIPCFAWL